MGRKEVVGDSLLARDMQTRVSCLSDFFFPKKFIEKQKCAECRAALSVRANNWRLPSCP